ncbi:MAG: phosphatase PAP2 family protein [Caulobacterales bacterium]|nr:phosphatase PAP2 family protein [Caulobacterales bacterium]
MAMTLGATLGAGPAAASDKGWRTVADVGLGGLAAAALGETAYERDWTGGKELALSLGVTEAETYGLKHAFPERRPNGRNNQSFPSGHTSLSFAAAGYLQERYGWQVGLPATAVATLVGVARVQSHDHHWYDVAAGAAIGELTAHLLTKPHDDNVRFLPWADTQGAGFTLLARF